MKKTIKTIRFLLAILLVAAGLDAHTEPAVITLDHPDWFTPEPVEQQTVRYIGQPAKNGRIDLTATNGFFSRCFKADGRGPLLPGDEGLIYESYDHLRKRLEQPGTARWHLWCSEPGEITATFYMTVPKEDAGHEWTIRIGEERQKLVAAESDKTSPQPQTLTFKINKPGQIELIIDCTKDLPAPNTLIHRIALHGSAITTAKLIRARWRPAAEHVGYRAPDTCRQPHMWVFETEQLTSEGLSFSPISTPFGYFGTSFGVDGKIAPGMEFNFSMWVAGDDATHAPPNEQLPRLLATSIPIAEFSFFGTEGTGIKMRKAVAYPDGADRAIQAMRIEYANGFWTFYGYFYDEKAEQWRLYAAGRKPLKPGQAEPDISAGTLPRTGSFVEVPGPAWGQRSGDSVRTVRRRGWFFDQDDSLHRALMELPPDAKWLDPNFEYSEEQLKSILPTIDRFVPQRQFYMADYAEHGWTAARVGGLVSYNKLEELLANTHPPVGKPGELPAYLQPEKIEQLYQLPYDIGEPKLQELQSTHAEIEVPINGETQPDKALLYYGTHDGVTYPQRDIRGVHATPAMKDLFGPTRAWQQTAEPVDTTANHYRFKLTGLDANTTY